MVHKAGIPSENQGLEAQASLEDLFASGWGFLRTWSYSGYPQMVPPSICLLSFLKLTSATFAAVGEPKNSQEVALERVWQATIDSLQGWLANVPLPGRLHSNCSKTPLPLRKAILCKWQQLLKPHLLAIVLQRLVDLDPGTPALVWDPHSGMLNIEIKWGLWIKIAKNKGNTRSAVRQWSSLPTTWLELMWHLPC